MLTHLPDDVQHEALKQLTPFNTALKETSSNALQMNDEDLEDELDDEELDLNATQMETIDDEKSFPNDKISIKVNDLLASTSNTVSRSDSPLTPLNSVTPKSITKKDSIKKGSKDTVKQLLIWPELW
ncbi:hypothetical protein HDU92_003175 [Lobulomyces angularis]|nr:hypothetical protein HDU92_003175 [Lobulomyces angularis]